VRWVSIEQMKSLFDDHRTETVQALENISW
jgi:hypothetical protein